MFRFVFVLAVAFAPAAFALEWKTNGPHRFAELSAPTGSKNGFSPVPASTTGISFTNVLTVQRGLSNQIFMSGSGVAAGDADGDGWCDLYFCGLDSPNRFYRNLGNWRFSDFTRESGVDCAGQASTGAVFADVDGDNDLDLLVTGLGTGVRLFLNDGRARFSETTRAAGLASNAGSMSMALADIDGDRDLDLYVANYRTSSLQDEPGLRFRVSTTNNHRAITHIDDRPVSQEQLNRYSLSADGKSVIENGEADFFYRNEGGGRFSSIPWTNGSFLDEKGLPTATPFDWGLSVMFRDMNGDLAPDIYVCNDSDSPDRIWVNDGRGKFRAISSLALRQTCLASMGVDFADINRDGLDDFFVADMLSRKHTVRHSQMLDRRRLQMPGQFETRQQHMRNMLYLNRGDGTYAEIAQFSGVEASDWSWMPAFLDVDLDGFEDLLITTGLERSLRDSDARREIDAARAERKLARQEFLELRRAMPRLTTPNYLFRNRGDLTFEDMSAAWGFDSTQVSHGMALADLDNDGDLDAVINCMNEPALLLRNECSAPRVGVRLQGTGANTGGVGAKIHVRGGPVAQTQEMIAGGRYLSGDDLMRVFAAGSATNVITIEVVWRNATRTVLQEVRPNRMYVIGEDGAKPVAQDKVAEPAPLLVDASSLLKHHHFEKPFNDFDRQPLLSRQLSQAGPGVSWVDVNRDGFDDLVVPSGEGGALGVFLNDQGAAFGRIDTSAVTGIAADDQTAVVSLRSQQGVSLLVGVSAYQTATSSSVAHYEVWAGGVDVRSAIPMNASSAGPLALSDVDADGDLDLFVGARVLAARYPENATSQLFINDGKDFQPKETIDGLVNSALFSDLNNDGFPELILANDWGSIRIFRNERGRLIEWDAPVSSRGGRSATLSRLKGWWNAVNCGDFNNDGRQDIIAANWGRNTRYQLYASRPLRAYVGDLDDNGVTEIIEAYHDSASGKIVPWARWDTLAQAVPELAAGFAGFKSFSEASVEQILGSRLKDMKQLEVNTLDSMLFLNRGDGFEANPLPVEAQLAPAFGISVADFDGDGQQDVFLAQNFFATEPYTSRYDAGRGLMLKGDGQGGLKALAAAHSGIEIYGEQRGAATADFDGDGRADLAVGQNGSATKLYRNKTGRAALRVRLRGTAAGNPLGIGASVRNASPGAAGPAREVRAGAGYWSQDSSVLLVSSASTVTRISVRWPGGKEVLYDVPADSREITLAMDGSIDVAK